MIEQALQPAKQIMLFATLLATRLGTAGRLAAAVTGIASRLTATVAIASITCWLATLTSITSRLAATVAGCTIRLTARGAALMAAEHPIEDLKTERLTTNGNAKNQRTEEQHTLHRATSPLLVNHARVFVPCAGFVTPWL